MSHPGAALDVGALAAEVCEESPDGIHCVHWWDCGPCCRCGADEDVNPDCDCDRHAAQREEARA